MPYKCTKCDKIVQDYEVQDCQCESNHFVQCPIIHFLHTEGEGPIFSKNQKVSNIPGKIETKVKAPIRITCTDRKDMEQCTVLASLISCPKCMDFLSSKRTSKPSTIIKDRPLDTDKLDISPDELEALKQIGLHSDHDDT